MHMLLLQSDGEFPEVDKMHHLGWFSSDVIPY